MFESSDIQAMITNGFPSRLNSAQLLLKVDNADQARAWLQGRLSDKLVRISSIQDEQNRKKDAKKQIPPVLQVGFTEQGLLALGVPEAAVEGLSETFLEGMAPRASKSEDSTRRAGILGDLGHNHQSNWAWGGQTCGILANEIHLLLLIFAASPEEIDGFIPQIVRQESGFVLSDGADPSESAAIVRTYLYYPKAPPNGHGMPVEHFGFADGFSQPLIKGTHTTSAKKSEEPDTYRYNAVAPGEFILGYPNERARMTPYPKRWDFGRNGTYLVVRQLEQHVDSFNALVSRMVGKVPYSHRKGPKEFAAAKIMGRWRDGDALLPGWTAQNGNGFGFAERDPAGLKCPIGSHVRRANPRDTVDDVPEIALRLTKRHRIIRRGRLYGPIPSNEDFSASHNKDVGLMFMCVNADIAQQFEFVQKTWLNNSFFGRLNGEVDPITAQVPDGGDRFRIQCRPAPVLVERETPIVSVKGGGYFFMPGIRALRRIAANDWTE